MIDPFAFRQWRVLGNVGKSNIDERFPSLGDAMQCVCGWPRTDAAVRLYGIDAKGGHQLIYSEVFPTTTSAGHSTCVAPSRPEPAQD